jgi:hypothetical protein
MIPIQKDIPIPKTHSGRRALKYLFLEMEIGDSFFVPLKGKHPIQIIQSLYRAARYGTPHLNLTCRAVEKNGVRGIRCWRVADRKELKIARAA